MPFKLPQGNSFGVSIRSPHRGEGRYPFYCKLKQYKLRFNPLPSPRRGEIYTFFV